MTDEESHPHGTLTHYHVCIHCGTAFRRNEILSREIATGIYHCSKCGLDGPLNVVIRDTQTTGSTYQYPGDLFSCGCMH